MRIEFSPEARLELHAAQDHYEGERAGLGLEFIADMEVLAARVLARPAQFPLVIGTTVRRAMGKRFPYMLVFDVLDTAIRVIAVAHAHREPGYWERRH